MRPSSPKRCVSLGSLKNRKRVFFSEKKRWFFRARFRVSKPPKRDGWVFLSRLWVPCSGLDAGFSNQKKEAILHFSNFTHLWTLTGDPYPFCFFTICVKMTWRWKSCYHIIHNVSMRPGFCCSTVGHFTGWNAAALKDSSGACCSRWWWTRVGEESPTFGQVGRKRPVWLNST